MPVGKWTIKPGSVTVLLGVLTIIFLILVLPQVDLLDTAFQRDTAPVVVHSQANASPVPQAVLAPFAFYHSDNQSAGHVLGNEVPAYASSTSLPVLHESLRC